MKKIFEDLAYRHYKEKNWAAMLILKLRMRLETTLSDTVSDMFNNDLDLAKKFLRIDRSKIITTFAHSAVNIPLTLENAVYIWNRDNVKNPGINAITPALLKDTP